MALGYVRGLFGLSVVDEDIQVDGVVDLPAMRGGTFKDAFKVQCSNSNK